MTKEIALYTENPSISLVYQAVGGAVRLLDQGQLGNPDAIQVASTLYVYEGVVDHAVWAYLMNLLKIPGIDLLVVTESIQGIHEEQLYVGGVSDVIVRKGINQTLMQVMLDHYRNSHPKSLTTHERPVRAVMLDDEPLWIDRLTQLCSPMIEVIGVTNERDLRELLNRSIPDIVCLDIVLGADSTGFDAFGMVNSICGEEVKIAFCTNVKFTKYMIQAYRLGANGYIQKPFTLTTPHRLMRILGRTENEK